MVQAAALAEEGLKLARITGSKLDIAHLLHNLGVAVAGQGDTERAATIWQQGLDYCRTEGDHRCVANILGSLGNAAHEGVDADQAQTYLQESLALYRDIDDPIGTSWVLASLGWIARDQGDSDRATRLFEESLTIGRERGGSLRVASALLGLGVVSLDQHKRSQGAQYLRECLQLANDLENIPLIASALDRWAQVMAMTGVGEQAATLLGASAALRDLYHIPSGRTERIGQQRLTTAITAKLGKLVFAEKWSAGQRLTIDEAISLLATFEFDIPMIEDSSVSAILGGIQVRSHLTDDLTMREREILLYMAQGQTDREIAERLFLSHRTVNAHVGHVLAKLGTSTRRDAVARARESGVLSPG